MQLLKSLIFVPGNRPQMLEKARNFDADIIMADLEDSVPAGEKLTARSMVRKMGPSLCSKGQRLMVRLNSLDTGLTRDDLAATIGPHLFGISVGKIGSPWDIMEIERITSTLERQTGMEPGIIKYVPWIENAMAVQKAYDIANASPRIVAVAFGAEDYTDDMGVTRTDGGEEFYFARASTAVAARAAGVIPLDTPYINFRDEEGMKRDVKVALSLGYKGKFAIHPVQLAAINEMFDPLLDDIAYARKVIDVWDQAAIHGKGSASLDGRMIDVPVVKRARKLLAIKETIDARSVAE